MQKLVPYITLAVLCASAATFWRHEQDRPEPAVHAAPKGQQFAAVQRDPKGASLKQPTQAEIRERFLKIPARLSREMFDWNGENGSRIVGIHLLQSRPLDKYPENSVVAEPGDSFDIVSVKPEEDIGCGCCTNDVVCESFDEDEFLLVSRLEGTRKLAVSSTHITDDCPLLLRSNPELESLDLSKNPLLTDRVLDAIQHLKNLRSLDLSDTALTGRGLSKLAALPRLERLVLARTQLTDDSLHELGNLQRLKELDLCDTGFTGAGFSRMKSLPALEILKLDEAAVTSDGLSSLPVLPALRVFSAWDSQLTDQPIDSLSRCAALEEINLNSTQVGDATFASFAPLPNLTEVRAYASLVTDDGLKWLQNKQHLRRVGVTSTRVQGPGLRHLANCPQLREVASTRGNNQPALADAETRRVLAGLKNLECLEIELSSTSTDPVPSLHLADMPLLRRLLVACPPETGDIVLSNMPSLTHLTIRRSLTPEDGYFGTNTPQPRPLPRIRSLQLNSVGPSDEKLHPGDPERDRYLRMQSVLELTSVVPDDLQLSDVRKLSRLRLAGRITEPVRRAFDGIDLHAFVGLDCHPGSSAPAVVSFVDQFVDGPVPEDGGYGPVLQLRMPRWTQDWSEAMRQHEGRVTRLLVETRGVDEDADFDLHGLRGLEELTISGLSASHVRLANMAPTLETVSLEECTLGTLAMDNGFGQLYCREVSAFAKLIVSSPPVESRWLHLFRTGQNLKQPNDPFTYAPQEVVLNDLGDIEAVSLDYGPGIESVVISGNSPAVREITYLPTTVRSVTANGDDVLQTWQGGGTRNRILRRPE